ncbi:acetolactate synthase large subunit [Streptomyces sp. S.PNR 29]|uniref:acetolactate synthase large subunit n=1 Tax=Streptomyces sp. S.PNR 29 TaxID=2973805 RepID=UPI0025B09D6B|nr:acetolactate synthase large subunit [Streptomyces sp. S.PNR 29]MDN0197960.1 acetolactate synthase large subunit [Streptomyces sp. S.PNR 29]
MKATTQRSHPAEDDRLVPGTVHSTPPAAPPRTPPRPDSTPLTGARALVRALEEAGCETVFGIPGGAIMPAYDALMDSAAIRHILVRHEQGAGHAATGYAQATGKVGVCMATSGPGATNLVTPLADAYLDSVPLVAITGQVPAHLLGTDAFQEVDIIGVTLPVTKHNVLVTNAKDIPAAIAEAFRTASTGRPGPVLVDITKDALQAETPYPPPARTPRPGQAPARPHPGRIRQAARLIAQAERPVLYVGGGVLKARATAELKALAELTRAPVTTTLMALGAFPDSHPLHVGMPGMHGAVTAVAALQKADLIVALGARFDDRVTGRLDSFAPHAKVVHADIDPAQIGKNRAAEVPIVGDARAVIADLAQALRAEHQRGHTGQAARSGYATWWQQLGRWRAAYPLSYDLPRDGSLSPQQVIERIGTLAPQGTVFASGVGQHQMWAAHYIAFEHPATWLNSGGAGTMGYAIPAAMGAKTGRPHTTVWAIDGDGCFQMTNQELATCALNDIPIKVAVINNGALGMVRQWQSLFYDGRYSNTVLHADHTGHRAGSQIGASRHARHGTRIPDIVKLSEALGCVALRCEDATDLDAVITQANEINDRPVVVDFIVHEDAMVWPMVAAGTSNDQIMAAHGVRPDFDGTEADLPRRIQTP